MVGIVDTARDKSRRLARLYADGDDSVGTTLLAALKRLYSPGSMALADDTDLLLEAVACVAKHTLKHRQTGRVHLGRLTDGAVPVPLCRRCHMGNLEQPQALSMYRWKGVIPESVCRKCLQSALRRYRRRRF